MKLLNQMFDEVFPLTGQHVDDRKFHHGVTSGLLAHAGACHVDQYLCGERRVVDAHAELHALVLRGTAHSLAHQVYAVSHVTHCVDRLNGHDMRFVVCEIGVGFDFLGHLIERGTVFQLHVYHASVDALTMLGFSPAPSAKVVEAILKSDPSLPVEQVVKLALKQIK